MLFKDNNKQIIKILVATPTRRDWPNKVAL
jgi:hypothetical protein